MVDAAEHVVQWTWILGDRQSEVHRVDLHALHWSLLEQLITTLADPTHWQTNSFPRSA